eukprot:c19093_g1_i1 orf=559-1284(-)
METDSEKAHGDPLARKARINAIWQQLNANSSGITLKHVAKGTVGEKTKPLKSSPPEWMANLGLVTRKPARITAKDIETEPRKDQMGLVREDGITIAAAALAAVRETSTTSKDGKIEVSEVRDFAGEDVKITKYVDPKSKAAQALKRKEELMAASSSGLDRLLQQIEKKPKLNVLDKTRKDWGDYKEEKGLEEELEAYNKSGDKYLDKVDFLQRTDLREYERERGARLAMQARRRMDSSLAE